MKTLSSYALVPWIASLALVILSGCGSSSGVTIPPPPPKTTPTPATSGEYLINLAGAPLIVAPFDPTTGAIGSFSTSSFGSVSGALETSVNGQIAATPNGNYLYGLGGAFAGIYGFQTSGPGFQLNPIYLSSGYELVTTSEYPESIVISPDSKYLYVIGSGAGPGTIHEYSIFPDTGQLKSVSLVSLQNYADIRTGVIDPTGRFFYVIELSDDRLYAFQISSTDGSLSEIAGSPYIVYPQDSTYQSFPEYVIEDRIGPSGKFLYVSTCPKVLPCSIFAYAVDGTTGALTEISGSPYTVAGMQLSFEIDGSGKFLYAQSYTTAASEIDGYAIDPNTGALSLVSTYTQPETGPIQIDPSGKYLYSYYSDVQTTPPVYSYYVLSIDSTTGNLSPVSGSPFAIPQSQWTPVSTIIMRIP